MCTKLATSKSGLTFPCGQCHNCRINRKRDWQARLLLEAAVSKYSVFITLTLGVDGAKDSDYCTFLDKRTVVLFLKRLRERIRPVGLRYLVVGEYGEKRGRAHYHALVFCSAPISELVVSEAWGLGHVDFGEVQQESIDYCLAYLLKGRSDTAGLSDSERIRRSVHPEFRLHSQGLGRAALPHLLVPDANTGELLLNREFRVLGRKWPVGRYFRQRYRGGSITELHNQGISDPVSETNEAAIERLLHEKLRSLQPGSPAYADALKEIQARREALVKRQQARRIRDYYRDLHKLNDRGRKNETF